MSKAERLQLLEAAALAAGAKADAAGKVFDAAAAAARAAGMDPAVKGVTPTAADKAAWKAACEAYGEAMDNRKAADAAYFAALNDGRRGSAGAGRA